MPLIPLFYRQRYGNRNTCKLCNIFVEQLMREGQNGQEAMAPAGRFPDDEDNLMLKYPRYSFSLPGVLLLTLASFLLPGQTMEKLTVDDGLSQGFVSCALQTRSGFLWFATLDGLNRYDGIRFEVFRPESARQTGDVRFMLEDKRGFLWILSGHDLFFF